MNWNIYTKPEYFEQAEAENEVKDNEAEELFNVLDTNQETIRIRYFGIWQIGFTWVRPQLC